MFFARPFRRILPIFVPIFCFVIAASRPALAEQRWISLTTPHFEMYTDNSAGSGIKALETFERVRSFFLEASPSKNAPDTPVRIIAFRSEKEFQAYRPSSGAVAYFQPSRKRDHIVMQDLTTDDFRVAVHEYTHLVIEHTGMKLPVWLDEGLADLYSSLEPKGQGTMIGRPIQGHLVTLSTSPWLDLKTLTSVKQDSPYYQEPDKMHIFYAQSWALTHMLFLGKDYQAGFSRFLAAIAGGADAETSFRSVYGKSLSQVRSDLDKYFKGTTVSVSVFGVRLEKVDLEPNVSELSALETELALVDLLASQQSKAGAAKERLARIAAEYPESAEAEESMGYFEWQSGNTEGAVLHFAKAFDKGATDPNMLFDYASLIGSQPDQREKCMEALRRALTKNPDHRDARYLLGLQQVNARLYGQALYTLSSLKTIKADQAFSAYSALAYCAMELKSPEQSRSYLLRAKQYARTSSEQERVEQLFRWLDTQENQHPLTMSSVSTQSTSPEEAPTNQGSPQESEHRPVLVRLSGVQRVNGLMSSVECHGKKLVLHVEADGRDERFTIEDPQFVVVRNNNETGFVNLACGPTKRRPVTVLFTPTTTEPNAPCRKYVNSTSK